MANHGVACKICYFAAGASLGAVVALLFAPKSGKETRKFIAQKAEESKGYVAARGRELRRQAEDLVDRGKEMASKHKERLADALEAGRHAARQTFAR